MQDPFELFGLTPGFFPDPAQVKKKFYQLSRQFHPDFLTQASPEEQAHALEQSAAVNQAYQVLTNPEAVMSLVLTREGLLTPDEKFQLPPDFLMEMMDTNEALVALEGDSSPAAQAQKETLRQAIQSLEASLYEQVEPLLKAYVAGTTPAQTLAPVKTYYFQKKYLNRLLENSW